MLHLMITLIRNKNKKINYEFWCNSFWILDCPLKNIMENNGHFFCCEQISPLFCEWLYMYIWKKVTILGSNIKNIFKCKCYIIWYSVR